MKTLLRSLAWPLRQLRRFRRRPRRLRFTRDGKYFVAISIGIGLAAINTGNNLLYLILGWLLSVIIASGVLSDLTMRALRVSRRPPGRVHANRPFLMEIAVENVKGRLASYSIEVEDLIDGKPLDKKCYFLKIPAGKIQRTSYRHTFSRRGIHRFDGFRVGSKFPFALFRKSRDVGAEDEILVYPAVFSVPPPNPRARRQGDTQAMRMGRRGEFFGLREYRDGDDRRDIHWRSTARLGRMLVREYEEEAQRRATIVCDNALPPGASEEQEHALEQAVSLAASLATTYLRVGYAVRLVTRGTLLPFGTGEAQLTRVLHTLALLETVTDEVRFSAAIDPRSESVLVIPFGSTAVRHRPREVSHVMEATG
ncbi:MAG TPA: DUF58 domain-containing protein [Kofleriaceae bacterium]|nr:DUF58 domain-containing protein [Kofleriaceae bacterium]